MHLKPWFYLIKLILFKNSSGYQKYFLIIFFVFSVNLSANAPTSITGLNQKWINVGFGGLGGSKFKGIGGSVSLNYYIDKYLISVRLVNAGDIFNYPMIPDNNPSVRNLNDISVTIGLIKKNKLLYSSASIGLGIVNDNKKIRLRGNNFTTIGIPFGSQLFYTPLGGMGIGINVVGNINPQASYVGLLLAIQWGILR